MSLGLLSLTAEEAARRLGCTVHTGEEPGLGAWHALGFRLESGVLVELVEHLARPVKGLEVRVDAGADATPAFAAVVRLLGLGSDSIVWTNPVLGRRG